MKRKTLEKKVYQYTAIFEPDSKLGGYTVTIPALPGCISEGDSFEAALKNIQEAAVLHLSVMQREKEEAPTEGASIIMAPIQIKA